MFINYDVNAGFSINTYRKPNGYANADVIGLIDDIVSGTCGNCPMDGALDALEDGELWVDGNANQEVIEELHALIKYRVEI